MKIKPYSRVVVEGMDGSGKTTLVTQMMEFFGDRAVFVPGYNRIQGVKSPLSQWWMEQLAHNPAGKFVVHDRFFYPELVYGPVLRNKVNADPSILSYVRELLRSHALLVYCRPPIAAIKKGVTVQSQMRGVHERFHDLMIQYDKVMIAESDYLAKDGRFTIYDWTKDDALLRLVNKITGYIYR